jgi:hypothetical protein
MEGGFAHGGGPWELEWRWCWAGALVEDIACISMGFSDPLHTPRGGAKPREGGIPPGRVGRLGVFGTGMWTTLGITVISL